MDVGTLKLNESMRESGKSSSSRMVTNGSLLALSARLLVKDPFLVVAFWWTFWEPRKKVWRAVGGWLLPFFALIFLADFSSAGWLFPQSGVISLQHCTSTIRIALLF